MEKTLPQKLSAVEKELGMALNDQQRTAVLTAIRSPVTILTGGPGTGKTLTQRALLALYKKLYPEKHRAVLRPHRPGRPPDGGIHRRARSHYS